MLRHVWYHELTLFMIRNIFMLNAPVTLTQRQLADFLLNVAPARPVFIWRPPGIGKSALVQAFAAEVGLPCVSLLGNQLAPEDLIGMPQIID